MDTKCNKQVVNQRTGVVRHDVKYTRIIWKLAKFYAHVDYYVEWLHALSSSQLNSSLFKTVADRLKDMQRSE